MMTVRVFCVAFWLAAAGFAMPVQAQDTLATRQAAVDRYLQAVPMAQMMDDTYTEMAKQVPAERRTAFMEAMRKVVRVEKIEEIARQSMIKTFTTAELNALADFYTSKDGASAMKKFGLYMGDVMPAVLQEVQRAVQELQAGQK